MAHGLRPLMTGNPLSFNRAGLIPLNLARPPHVQTDAGGPAATRPHARK
jgi:hypothetical protein